MKYTLVHLCKNIDGVHTTRSYMLAIIPEDPYVVYTAICLKYFVYKYNEVEIFEPMFTKIEYCLELEGTNYQPSGRIIDLWDFIKEIDKTHHLSNIKATTDNKELSDEYFDKLYTSIEQYPFVSKSIELSDYLSDYTIQQPQFYNNTINKLQNCKTLTEKEIYVASLRKYLYYMEGTLNAN